MATAYILHAVRGELWVVIITAHFANNVLAGGARARARGYGSGIAVSRAHSTTIENNACTLYIICNTVLLHVHNKILYKICNNIAPPSVLAHIESEQIYDAMVVCISCRFEPVVRLDELSVCGVRLVVLTLKRAGTTLAAESRASNVITHEATTMKPANRVRMYVINN